MPLTLFFFTKKKQGGLWFLAFYLFYSMLTDLVLNKLSLKFFNSEIYSYRLFTIIEFIVLSAYLLKELNSDKSRLFIKISSLVFGAFVLFDLMTGTLNEFDSIPTGVESILILCSSLLVLYERIIKNEEYNVSSIWISIGLVLFFSGTFFLFILSESNFNDSAFSETYSLILASFKIISYILFSIGIALENKNLFKPTYTHNLQKA
ncbi:MAG: hypothetical protein RL713_453 [Bacteroidota bacterium]|jgi:uncharacterized membrane protein YgdD (TMEM256/DUF423 family)